MRKKTKTYGLYFKGTRLQKAYGLYFKGTRLQKALDQ